MVGFLLFPLLFCGLVQAIDLHLDNSNSGFFFQQSLGLAKQQQQHLSKFLSIHSFNGSSDHNKDVKPLLRERLAILGPTQPSRIEVSYGPFEAKQSLPAKLVIPVLHFPHENLSIPFDNSEHTLLDITAHVVNTELRRENPVLRVLFHSGKHFHSFNEEDAAEKKSEEDHMWEDEPSSKMMETCIALKVESQNMAETPLITTCVPKGMDGVCLASVAVPFNWWKTSTLSPSFPSLSSRMPVATPKPNKAVRNLIELSYTVYETVAGQCAFHQAIHKDKWHKLPGHHKNSRRPHTTFPPANAILIQSATLIGSLRLLPNMYAPRDLVSSEGTIALSPTLRFVSSAAPLYPQSFLYVTVLLDTASQLSKDEPYAVVVRAKVKNGLRIVSTQTSNPAWNLNFDVNGKHISAAVTAVRNFSVASPNQSQELFTWLLAVNVETKDGVEMTEGVRALWSWTIRSHSPYRTSSSSSGGSSSSGSHAKDALDEVKGKLTSRFEILKDEVQTVFPIIKRHDIVNTAILTSRQVSEPLRVFVVTQAGKVADVTLQASCSSADESVLKVSSSCTSVYLDGSEVRGSTKAKFAARFGNVEASGSITVWVPEMPLEIQVDDIKLSHIHGWKVDSASSAVSSSAAAGSSSADRANQCRLRYQQSSFEVYARFYAEDHDSGRVSYFLSRKSYLLITELVRKLMRIQDPRVAALKHNYVEGLKPGTTDIEVMSPMSGNVIGSREIHVTSDKVDVTGLSVQVISGLTLNILPDVDLESCYHAHVDISEMLHSKYQEAVLDLTLHLSDGSTLPLRHVDRSHYDLQTQSQNTSILAVTSPVGAAILRVLALDEGNASVNLMISVSESCRKEEEKASPGSHHALATGSALVRVILKDSLMTSVQNDARTGHGSRATGQSAIRPDAATQSYMLPHAPPPLSSNQIIAGQDHKRKMAVDPQIMIKSQGQLTFSKPGSTEFGENQLSLKDDSNAVMMLTNGAFHPHGHSHSYTFHPHSNLHMTPLEIGMYVLLAVFCAAISVFVATCIVYASRARKGQLNADDVVDFPRPSQPPQPPLPPTLSAPSPLLDQFRNLFQKNKRPQDDNGEEGAPQEISDNNWIWLGRPTSLDAECGSGERKRPSPSSRQPFKAPKSKSENERFSSNCADKRSNRMSGISYSGSEVSVRITTRPQDGGRLTYTAQLCFDTLDSQSSASELIHPPEAPIDSRTFTKSRSTTAAPMRIIANPHFPAVPVHDPAASKEEAVEHERHHEEEVEEVAEETDELLTSDVVIRRMKHSSRPVNRLSEQDTRRYARSWLMAGEAVPRDFNSNSPASPSESSESSVSTGTDPSVIVQDGDSNSPILNEDSQGTEQCLATFLRHGSPDIKQANIIENPRYSFHSDKENSTQIVSAASGESAASSENGAAVDYDRIISFLGILKETSA